MPSDVDGSASDLGDVMAESSTTDPVVSIVLPTFNEGGNIVSMLERLDRALADLPHELIVVDDDSPDETWRIAQEYAADHPGIHVIRRSTERGLSSAVLAGMRAARGRVLGVIDADGQHDEAILPEMTERVLAGADICIGSRAVEGGGYGDWGKGRRFASWLATAMAHMMLQVKATDPMSGFFVMSRDHYEALQGDVNPRGFKVLLEFLSRSEPKVDEVGYVFRNREEGETKLSGGVVLDYLLALIELRFGLIVSAQFTRYALVGSVGLLINLVAFLIAFGLGAPALIALLIGIQISIVFNFTGHNLFSFRPTNYRGKRWWKGLAVYEVFSLYGLAIQGLVFEALDGPLSERLDSSFWAAGLSNLLAIGMAAVANYLLHERFTWGRLGLELSRPKRSRR
ncbi:MAG: glycosyltransferase family 2 protein [Acidimicrobiales bacterium]